LSTDKLFRGNYSFSQRKKYLQIFPLLKTTPHGVENQIKFAVCFLVSFASTTDPYSNGRVRENMPAVRAKTSLGIRNCIGIGIFYILDFHTDSLSA
jgi:hypothetical protein